MSNSARKTPRTQPAKPTEGIRIRQTASNTVPKQNVVDLRSVVARRELVAARQDRLKKQQALRQALSDKPAEAHPKPASGKLFALAKPKRSHWFGNRGESPLEAQVKQEQSVRRSRPAANDGLPPLPVISSTVASEPAVTQPKRQAKPPTARRVRQPKGVSATAVRVKAVPGKAAPAGLFANLLRPVGAFAVVALILILPASVSATLNKTGGLEESVTVSAEQAFQHLQEAGTRLQGFQFAEAGDEFRAASDAFADANAEIASINQFVVSLAQYIPGKGQAFTAGTHLIAAGEELSAAGEQLSAALDVLNTADLSAVAADQEQGITALLLVVHSALAPSAEHVGAALMHLEQVDPADIPEDKRDLVVQAKTSLPTVHAALQDGLELTEILLAFLGHDQERRYLVLFQNNYELRPTGGFIGSLAIIELRNGVVTGLEIPGGGVYDISGQFQEKVISPEPLHLVNPHWNLQDANWFPHFPSSAQKIQWFYEQAGGEPVDGVITLVPSVIEQMLEVTGPIDMTEQYGVTITAENFYDEVQVRAEEKYDVTRESKKILADMTPKLFTQLFAVADDPEGLIRLSTVLRSALAEKDILVAMNDLPLQDKFSARDWSGELKSTDRDYLAVIHANIAGGKTDAEIEEVIKHRAEIQADGSIIDTVTLTRVHKGPTSDVLSGLNNTDYVRFYVPEGSILHSATGFESPDPNLFLEPDPAAVPDADYQAITGDTTLNPANGITTNQEFGKTVFGGWMQTRVGESSTVTLRYQLPFTVTVDDLWNQTDRYSLLVQKQPGSFGSFLTSEVSVAPPFVATRYYPDDFTGSQQTVLDRDLFTGLVLERAK